MRTSADGSDGAALFSVLAAEGADAASQGAGLAAGWAAVAAERTGVATKRADVAVAGAETAAEGAGAAVRGAGLTAVGAGAEMVVALAGFLSLLQLIDSAFPTGAFAHSFGLETAIQEGRVHSGGELFAWLASYTRGSLTPFDAVGVYFAHRYALEAAAVGADWEGGPLIDLDRRLTVARLARESREGSIKIAKRYLHMALELHPESGLDRYAGWIREGTCFGSVPLIHGWMSAYLGQTPRMAMLTHLYAAVNSLLQVALRAMAIGQTEGHKVLRALFPLLENETERVLDCPPDPQGMSCDAFVQEIAAMRHETLYSRLFMS